MNGSVSPPLFHASSFWHPTKKRGRKEGYEKNPGGMISFFELEDFVVKSRALVQFFMGSR